MHLQLGTPGATGALEADKPTILPTKQSMDPKKGLYFSGLFGAFPVDGSCLLNMTCNENLSVFVSHPLLTYQQAPMQFNVGV